MVYWERLHLLNWWMKCLLQNIRSLYGLMELTCWICRAIINVSLRVKNFATFSTNLHLLFLTLRPLWSISDAFRRSLDFHSVEITEVINVEINKVPLVSLCKSCQRLLSIVSATQKWLCEKHSAIFVLVLSKSLFLQNLSNHTSLQSLGSTETKLFNNS